MSEVKHTPNFLPVAYRNRELDDWGIVRAANGYVMCQVRDPERLEDEHLSAAREAKVDPWEDAARYFVQAVNSHGDLVEALRRIKEALDDGDDATAWLTADTALSKVLELGEGL